jgi:Putative threonine efflux protein
MLECILKGIIVGAGASIPLGPIGVMCIQKTLSKGRASGYLTGAGASVADSFYAMLAILSLAVVKSFISHHQPIVMLIGGTIVAVIGLKIFLTNPIKQIRMRIYGEKKLFGDFITSFIMTITNPGALFLILGLFAFANLNVDEHSSMSIIFAAVAGVFIGANLWWVTLCTSINVFRNKLRLRQLMLINRISGIIIMAIGLFSVGKSLWAIISPLLLGH